MDVKFFIILTLIRLNFSKEILTETTTYSNKYVERPWTLPFPEDHPCEIKTSLIIKHLLNETELPLEYQDYYKMIFYSGNGPNDLGDWIGCNKMIIAKYHIISVNDSLTPSPVRLGLCYLKECDVHYLNNFKAQIAILLKQYKNITFEPQSLVVSYPEGELEKLKNDNLIGFCVITIILGILFIFNLLQFILKRRNNRSKDNIIFSTYTALNEEASSRQTDLITDNDSKKPEKETSKMRKFLKLFDFEENISKILEVRNEKNTSLEALRIFDGLKFLSAFWIVHCHTIRYAISPVGVRNTPEIFSQIKTLPFSFWLSTTLAVDIFFFISGFLTYLNLQKYLNKKINPLKLLVLAIFNRIIRLYPMYLFAVFGTTYIMPFISNGPFYYQSQYNTSDCSSYFWANLLFINNFIKIPNNGNCLGQSWYLANDMQFFVISLIICLGLNKFNKIRNIIFAILLIGSRAYSFIDSYLNDYQGLDYVHPHNTTPGADFFFDLYVKPWTNAFGYILGIFFCQLYIETPVYKNDNVSTNSVENKKKILLVDSMNL